VGQTDLSGLTHLSKDQTYTKRIKTNGSDDKQVKIMVNIFLKRNLAILKLNFRGGLNQGQQGYRENRGLQLESC